MNTEMIIKRIPVSELKPAKYNPRKDLKPGDPAYEKIKRSLAGLGAQSWRRTQVLINKCAKNY